MWYLSLGRVQPVLTLVGYPDEVGEMIAFVFNDTLICNDALEWWWTTTFPEGLNLVEVEEEQITYEI
jgi:hypothetical protein